MGNNGIKFISAVTALTMMTSVISPELQHINAFGETYTLAIDTSSRPFIWPLPSSNRISTCFTCGRAHNALDISAPIGEKILASCDGVVEEARTGCTHFAVETPCDCNGSTGNCIVLRHNINGVYYWTVYMHMNDVYVEKGQEVKQGDVIGTVGSTGRAYGSHLDFSIRLDSAWSKNKLDPGYNTVLPPTLVRYSSNDCCVAYLKDITHRSYKASEAPVLSGIIGCSSTASEFSWGLSLSADKYCLKITGSDGSDHSVDNIDKEESGTTLMLPVGNYTAYLETSYPDGNKVSSNKLEFEIGEAPLLECENKDGKTYIKWSKVKDAQSYKVNINERYESSWDPGEFYDYPFFTIDETDEDSAELVLPAGSYSVNVDALIADGSSRKSNTESFVCEDPIMLSYDQDEDGNFKFSWPGCSWPGKYELAIRDWYYDDYSLTDLTEPSAEVQLPPGQYTAYVRYMTGEYSYYTSEYVSITVEEPIPDTTGDANGDGVTDGSDMLMIKSYIFETDYDYYEFEFDYADTNSNGEVDLFDLMRLKRKLLEEI